MRFKIPAKQPANFKASVLYLAGLSKGQTPDRVSWVMHHNLLTESPRAAAAIMEATASQNLRCKQHAYHFVLAFDPKDAKRGKVPPEVMQDVAREAIKRLGLTEHQALVYAHKDTDHPHIHFLVNRVHPITGKAYDRHGDGLRLRDLCRDIANERGLNVLQDRARIAEREHVDDFDDISPPPTDGEYWQAKRDNREAENPLSKERVLKLRKDSQQHFYNASNWWELTTRLSGHGISLERKGQGIIVMTDDGYAKLSQMGKKIRLQELEERFGESFDDWMKRFTLERAKQAEIELIPSGYDAMSAAEKRRAENLQKAKLAVERKKGDPVLEANEAEEEYRYWRGIKAFVEYTSRHLSRAEAKRVKQLVNKRRYLQSSGKAKKAYLEALGLFFDDGKQASERWKKIESEYGQEKALKIIKKNPSVLGEINISSRETSFERVTKRDFNKLLSKIARKRRLWQDIRFKLVLNRERLNRSISDISKAKADLNHIQTRFLTRYNHREYLLSVVERRNKAYRRLRAEDIRLSNLSKERKDRLIFQHRKYKREMRKLEKQRAKQREMEV